MIKKLWGLAISAILSAGAFEARGVVQVDIDHDTSGVRLGYWTSDFAAAKDYADKYNVPFVGFWGSAGCGYCALMKSSGLLSDEFLEWVKTHKIVMCYVEVAADKTSIMTPAKEFIKGSNKSGLYPFMTFYWKKTDGSSVKVDFSGRKGSIPPYAKGTTGARFVAGLDNYFGSYKPVESYTGGYFATTNNTAGARLEALVGKTSVNVPLVRTATVVATNKLQVGSAAATSVVWAKGVTKQVVKCNLPAGLSAGTKVALRLLTSDGKSEKSKTYVNIVNEPACSLTNPKWLGENFEVGEWTMDLDAALAKAAPCATAKYYTLAYSSGVLWCPYCASLETKVLANAKFTEWAKANNVNLVLLDNPKRSASDVKDANGNVTSVGTKPDGAPPTLLRWETGANGKSGAAYLSRKNIAQADAEKVLQRNHDLLYKGGKLAAPEAMRTGYPTLILVNPDGTAAAYLYDGCDDASRSWGLTLDETLARLDELILLDGANMNDSKPSTTTQELAVEDYGDGGGQVNANTMFFKLGNVPAGKVTFEAFGYTANQTEFKPLLAVYETSSTLAKANKIASGTGSLTATFANGNNKFLSVSHYGNNIGIYGRRTGYSFSLSSTVTLVPAEASASFTTQSGKVNLSVVAGNKYKLSGFSSYPGLTKNSDGTYTAAKTATLAMTAPAGTKLTFQLWRPGTIQFVTTSAAKLESDGSGTISVSRTGGSSAAATVTISVDKGSNSSGRVSVSPASLTWADGASGSKTVTYKIAKNAAFNPDETFTFSLATSPSTYATVGANKTFTLKVSDSDEPVLADTKFAVRLYKGMSRELRYAVGNIRENQRVSISRSGALPGGMKLAYDYSRKELVLSGKPSRAAKYDFTVAITERRSDKTVTGQSTAFVVTVVDPKKLTAGEVGYNPIITAGSTVYGSIPVYGKLNGHQVLAGVATLKAYRTGRMSISYRGTDGARASGSAALVLDDSGRITSVYSRQGMTIQFAADNKGVASLKIVGLANRFGSTLAGASTGHKLFNGNFADYQGYYTVTLPVNTAELVAGKETLPTGTGYVNLKMNTSTFRRSGKVSYAGMLPNGRSFSGYAYLSGAMLSDDGSQWAYLPISVNKSGTGLGAVLRIRKNAFTISETNPQAVLAAPSAVPFLLAGGDFAALDVYGGIYDKTLDFSQCCEQFYETMQFKFVALTDWFAPSEKYGAIKTLPNSTVHVEANDSFTIANADRSHVLSLKLSKSTGVVSGRMFATFANGKKVSLTIKGAVLVGWIDCGCNDSSAAVISRPIFSGTAYYSDRIDGTTAKRGFAVELVP